MPTPNVSYHLDPDDPTPTPSVYPVHETRYGLEILPGLTFYGDTEVLRTLLHAAAALLPPSAKPEPEPVLPYPVPDTSPGHGCVLSWCCEHKDSAGDFDCSNGLSAEGAGAARWLMPHYDPANKFDKNTRFFRCPEHAADLFPDRPRI